MPRGAYITQILTAYYETQNRKGDKTMEFTKTLAFQIPEELFNRIKDHLDRERQRTGRKLSQKDFVIGLIERELEAASSGSLCAGGDGALAIGAATRYNGVVQWL